MSLSAIDRIEHIRAQLAQAGRVRVVDLATQLAVSEMTIRRDLDVLAEEGLVRRVRGGAVDLGPQPFAERFTRQAKAKEKIAAKLLDLVGDGGAIGLDASTTLQRLATLVDVRDLTVVTNGLDTFLAIDRRPGVTALLTGGQLDSRTGSFVGPLATRSAHDVLLRRLFVSAAGLHPDLGSSEATLDEAAVKLALADVSAEIVLAVDASKLDQRSPARALSPERITMLVTDLDPSDPRLDPYRDRWEIR